MDTSRVDLNLLLTLEALLAEQNVTRAAARLHLSQPAVSAQLARLRQLFDDPLLLPVQRGMLPTARAEALREPLRSALDALRATLALHREFDPARAELTVSVACTDFLQVSVVAEWVLRLRRIAPGIRVAIRQFDFVALEAQMLRGDVDLVLSVAAGLPAMLRRRPLLDEHFVLIGRRDHPALGPGLDLERFATLEHVVVSPAGGGFETPTDAALAALGQRRKVVLSAASFLFVPDLVARTDLVALVPERLVRGRAEALSVVPCPFPLDGFQVEMAWHERNHTHPAQRWLREQLVDAVAAHDGRDASG